MGNAAKRQRTRHGISRPGPAARLAQARLQEELQAVVAENARERKARQRARDRQRVEETQLLVDLSPDPEGEDHLTVRELNRRSLR